MTKYKLKYSSSLTKAAQSIFGNVVVKAYHVSEVLNYKKEEDHREYFKRKEKVKQDGKSIDFDGEDLVIEFSTGKKVMFHSSEWAHMEAFHDENVE